MSEDSPGAGPSVVVNRFVNPVVRTVLRSPAHRLLSGRVALLTLTGRESGRRYPVPVGYERTPGGIRINVAAPQRKRWWRNLTGAGAPVGVRLTGVERTGTAIATGDERRGVTVEVTLE